MTISQTDIKQYLLQALQPQPKLELDQKIVADVFLALYLENKLAQQHATNHWLYEPDLHMH